MKPFDKYYTPTPKKWRKIGDAMLLLSTGASGSIMGLPLSDNLKLWIVFAFSVIGVFGKILTNFAEETPNE